MCYLRIAAVEGGVTKSMVELNVVTTRLQLMRRQILPLMDALLKGAPDEVQERNLRLAELERIGENLRLIVRDIQSEQNRLQAMQRNLGSIPRDNRWSTNQSLDQQQKNLQYARKQAEDLAEAIRQLMQENCEVKWELPDRGGRRASSAT
jgi:hypothetical protein